LSGNALREEVGDLFPALAALAEFGPRDHPQMNLVGSVREA
jgi:hypothetical protein